MCKTKVKVAFDFVVIIIVVETQVRPLTIFRNPKKKTPNRELLLPFVAPRGGWRGGRFGGGSVGFTAARQLVLWCGLVGSEMLMTDGLWAGTIFKKVDY